MRAPAATLAAAALIGTALAAGGTSAASASQPSVTLSGEAGDESTPASKRDRVTSVQATLTGSTAAGSLHTEGSSTGGAGPYGGFDGQVSCMRPDGKRVTVGAFGQAWQVAEGVEGHKALPGSYAQLLTVEFAKRAVPGPFGETTVSESFKTLGADDQGVPSEDPPNCESGSFEGLHPDINGVLHISPSITSPLDGAVNDTGSVTLSGTAEPGAVVVVFEPAGSVGGTVVNADLSGSWTATLGGLALGIHVFSAFVLPGSTIPSNTVEIEEVASAGTPPPPAGGTTTTAGATPSPTPGHGVLSSKEARRAPVPAARLASTSLPVDAAGWVTLAITCPAAETTCAGSITLRTISAITAAAHGRHPGSAVLTLASGTFRVHGGRTRKVRLHLSARGRALLARSRRLPVRATIRAHDPAGVTHTVQMTATLRPAPPALHHGQLRPPSA